MRGRDAILKQAMISSTHIFRTWWLCLLSLSSLFVCASLSAQQAKQKPNFVFLLGDDISAHMLGAYGGQIKTPHLDALAKEGMRFNNVYSNVAMCAPFRQELYSGRTSWRTKTLPNHSKSVAGTRSIPHYLREAGYKVGLVGKSHVGPRECYPFDMLGDVSKKEDPNPACMEKTTAYVDAALKGKMPFCVFVASHDGHGPSTTGDRSQYPHDQLKVPPYWKDTPAMRKSMAEHFAEVSNLDKLLGKLKKLIVDRGLEKNTILVFCSEQGCAMPFGKWTAFNNGLRSCIVASWPGVIPKGECDQLFWIADVAPTFCEAAGKTYKAEAFDGKSQWQNFLGKDQKVHDYTYGAFSNCNILDNRERIFPIRSVRDKRYSLIWSPNHTNYTSNTNQTEMFLALTGEKKDPNPNHTVASWLNTLKGEAAKEPMKDPLIKQLIKRPEWALYDLSKDPYELNNLIDDPALAGEKQRLKAALLAGLAKWDDSDPIKTEKSLVKGGGKKPKKKGKK